MYRFLHVFRIVPGKRALGLHVGCAPPKMKRTRSFRELRRSRLTVTHLKRAVVVGRGEQLAGSWELVPDTPGGEKPAEAFLWVDTDKSQLTSVALHSPKLGFLLF